MADNEIILRIQPIANGFVVTGSKSLDTFSHAELPDTYVGTRGEVLAGLPSLFEAADALTNSDAQVDF